METDAFTPGRASSLDRQEPGEEPQGSSFFKMQMEEG